MIPSNATSILKSLISTKLNPLFSKLNGLFFPKKTPEAKKPVPVGSETADFIERHEKSIKELEALAEKLGGFRRKDDLKQEKGLNNSVPEDCQKQIIATTTYKNLGSKNNTKIIINHSCYAPVQTEEQLKLMRTNASILKSKNRYEINPAHKPTQNDLMDTPLKGSRSYRDKKSLTINLGTNGIRLNSAQESLLVENLGTKKPVRSTNSDNFVPLSLIQDVSEPIVPLSSLQKEQESSLTKSNENNEKKADISLVISKEGEEDLSTLQVPLDEHDGPQRREREQLGIDPSPSKSRRPVDDSRYNEYRGAKSSMVGSRNQPSGEESGLASENNGAGTKIIQRSEAFNAVVPKSSLHGIGTQQVSPDPQQNHLP